jgi:hypothetical protein
MTDVPPVRPVPAEEMPAPEAQRGRLRGRPIAWLSTGETIAIVLGVIVMLGSLLVKYLHAAEGMRTDMGDWSEGVTTGGAIVGGVATGMAAVHMKRRWDEPYRKMAERLDQVSREGVINVLRQHLTPISPERLVMTKPGPIPKGLRYETRLGAGEGIWIRLGDRTGLDPSDAQSIADYFEPWIGEENRQWLAHVEMQLETNQLAPLAMMQNALIEHDEQNRPTLFHQVGPRIWEFDKELDAQGNLLAVRCQVRHMGVMVDEFKTTVVSPVIQTVQTSRLMRREDGQIAPVDVSIELQSGAKPIRRGDEVVAYPNGTTWWQRRVDYVI